jgi:hypothetical protein
MKPQPLSREDLLFSVFLAAFVAGVVFGVGVALAFGPCGG